MSRKVLIFTYYWPPSAGAHVQRYLKFSKYLNLYNWEPIIITPENPSVAYKDDTLADDIHPSIQVIKTQSSHGFSLRNLFKRKKKVKSSQTNSLQKQSRIIADEQIVWKKSAIDAAIKLLQKQQIDAILTTGPPHSTHLIGLNLKEKFDLPWLVDMCESWTEAQDDNRLPAKRRKDKRLQDKVLKGADRVIVVSPGLRKEFSSEGKLVELIYDGFDEQDMFHKMPAQSEKFTLSFVGDYMPDQNCDALWKVLAEFAKEQDFRNRFRLCFTGNVDPIVLKSIVTYNLESLVEVEGFVPHYEATQRMQAANMLLFIIPNTSGNQHTLTGSIFEYLAAKRPMLSIGPKMGNAAEVISEAGRDPMLDYLSRADIKKQILHYYIKWKNNNGEMSVHSDDSYMKFSRKSLTSKLADVLDETLESF